MQQQNHRFSVQALDSPCKTKEKVSQIQELRNAVKSFVSPSTLSANQYFAEGGNWARLGQETGKSFG
jgi:hypothetical protein